MSYFKKLTFLKVLTTIAWADGEVTQSELNILKSFYRKFDLDKGELAELINKALTETDAQSVRDMGKVMGWLKPRVQGRADMGAVSSAIKQKLSP